MNIKVVILCLLCCHVCFSDILSNVVFNVGYSGEFFITETHILRMAGLADTNTVWVSSATVSESVRDGSISAPYTTIDQSVIDNSSDRTIIVCPGTYSVSPVIISNSVVIKSISRNPALVKLYSDDIMFRIDSGDLVLDGFTIISTNTDSGSPFVTAGVVDTRTSTRSSTVRNCIFECYSSVDSSSAGAAINNIRASDCKFYNCYADGSLVIGGAAYDCDIYSCIFTNSYCDAGGGAVANCNIYNSLFVKCSTASSGGAAYNCNLDQCLVYSCDAGSGAAVYNVSDNTLIRDCIITNCIGSGDGTSLYIDSLSSIHNCVILGDNSISLYLGNGAKAYRTSILNSEFSMESGTALIGCVTNTDFCESYIKP